MKPLLLTTLIITLTYCLAHGELGAAAAATQDASPSSGPTAKKNPGKKPTGKRGTQKKSYSDHDTESLNPEDEEKAETDATTPGSWFPDWPADKFGWILQPVLAFKYTQGVNESTGTVKTTTVEGGLAAGLKGVPVIPGNPGFVTGPKAGMAFGYTHQQFASDDGDQDSSGHHYRRQWAGLDNTMVWRAFRYSLDITRGRIFVVENPDEVVNSFRAVNDFGVLLRSWWSGHYTISMARAYRSRYAKPFLTETDHWIHTRVFTDFLGFVFDLGPGFTDVAAWDIEGEEKSGTGHVDYFLIRTQFSLFWKIVGEGIGKYAFDASEKRLGLYASTRMPEEDLNEPPTLAMPKDSFMGSFFLGAKDIFFGVGAGWRYNIQILNVSEKDESEKETTKDHGLGLYYEVRL